MKQKCLDEDYKALYQLLAAWFPERDYEDKSFKEIINDYKDVSPESRLISLRKEFDLFFLNKDITLDEIVDAANIDLESDEEMYEWLHELYGYLFNDE